ncbi:hypothetical protein J7T55_000018 [Diaporthe amygdali]|uniref:uncharacterized protein n=1 Tax=Phomopsis amygdali TaxID=1214568 RepID=UPI0022FE4E8A|nr:uncharacterized protein J7T55_000018 [Diaporthe amygdali]KAJ0107756.1 hypothetical protein J7T55_000018 [Diaporthe amygdali]
MSDINDSINPRCEDPDIPWAAPDDMQYDRAEAALEASHKEFGRQVFRDLLESLAIDRLGKTDARIVPPVIGGSYNVIYGLALDDSPPKRLLRVPNANVAFADEKTAGECVIAQFLQDRTSIPTASVLHYGLSHQTPEVGPHIIMKRIEHFWSMSSRLNKRYKTRGARHILDNQIPRDELKALDMQMAHYLLQLLPHRFPRIGTLARLKHNTYVVQTRPLTIHMQQMIELSNIPRSALPRKDETYSTADEWYTACSRMHIAPLLFQQNDFIITANDCRNKYVSRLIFHRLAKEGKLSQFGFEEDSCGSEDFVLWCDDLRPGNVLLSEGDEVVGIVDWEFTYVGPTQFALDPPWWLCLDNPHNYDDGGLECFTKVYEKRVKTWLEAVEEVEKKVDPVSLRLPHGMALSRYMRESWETGRFWLSYAIRKTWAFDQIYWKYLDERFFGKRPDGLPRAQLWTTRLHLLNDRERDQMESFVQKRMEETKVRKLIDHWDPKDVQRRFDEILGEDGA